MTDFWPKERRWRRNFGVAVVKLVGHLIGTGVIFFAFISVGWVVGRGIKFLHSIDPFPDEIYQLIGRFKVYLVWVDATLCLIVLLAGVIRFYEDFLGKDKSDGR